MPKGTQGFPFSSVLVAAFYFFLLMSLELGYVSSDDELRLPWLREYSQDTSCALQIVIDDVAWVLNLGAQSGAFLGLSLLGMIT